MKRSTNRIPLMMAQRYFADGGLTWLQRKFNVPMDSEHGEEEPPPRGGVPHTGPRGPMIYDEGNRRESAINAVRLNAVELAYVEDEPLPKLEGRRGDMGTGHLVRRLRLGLAPMSLYPYCDFCAKPGTVQIYGRWAFHARCYVKAQTECPATTSLSRFDGVSV